MGTVSVMTLIEVIVTLVILLPLATITIGYFVVRNNEALAIRILKKVYQYKGSAVVFAITIKSAVSTLTASIKK